MKICAIICEYNPFHNGHLYQLKQARALSGADAVLCLMSGNFVQRGEAAILNKHVRAQHAVMAGADVVLELPTVFATSNAELFARGAISLLSSIPEITHLCFGAETADEELFYKSADMLLNEPEEISTQIKDFIAEGMSYAKARALAWNKQIPENLLSSPNNILGIEYTKALLALQSSIRILPITRVGSGYSDKKLTDGFSSATAIREALNDKEKLSKYLPDFVLRDLPSQTEQVLDALEKYAVLSKSNTDIASVCDCNEGLENAFKKAALNAAPLVQTLTSPRYTSARIRRIALQNLLNIDEALIRKCLSAPLYLQLLAINRERKDVLSAIANSKLPLLTRGKDVNVLDGVALQCYQANRFADDVYSLLYKQITENKEKFL